MIEQLLGIQKAPGLIQSTAGNKGMQARGRVKREGRHCLRPVPGCLVQSAGQSRFSEKS